MARMTTDPTDPELGHGTDDTPGPQNPVYLVLSEAEIQKGFIRPYRDTYLHTVCGTTTKMGYSLAATYARQPDFYGATYCANCQMHKPVAEFVWGDGTKVGS
jgi:hypothetical protein